MKVLLTLCYIHEPSRLLLGLKKRGFGKNRWNGFGGKLKDGEALIDAAKREVFEETSMVANELVECGLINFSFKNTKDIFEVHIFRANSFTGEPHESDEMKPQWFNINEIPYTEMWSSDKHWLPLFLANKKFKGNFLFDDKDKVIEFDLKEIS